MNWQSIDSAPRDGTSVLVIPMEHYTHAFWQDGFWWWHNLDSQSYAAGPEPEGWSPVYSGVSSSAETEPQAPVAYKDTRPEAFMPKVNGVSFRCDCGCNVFHKPDSEQPMLYECNGCGARYRGG